jgi:phenylalanine-4-hydroxylase
MRTQYHIDRYQETYFVIDDFGQLFAATRPDFAPIYRDIAVSRTSRRRRCCRKTADTLFPGRAKKKGRA